MSDRLKDYESWCDNGRDPFEDFCGPFFMRRNPDGMIESAFEALPHHCNGHGNIHGGALMSFADYSLFAIARDALADGTAVTVTFTSEFIAAGAAGDLIKGRGVVSRTTKRLVFVRGEIFTDAQVLMTFSGVLMKRDRRV